MNEHKDVTIFAETTYRNQYRRFGIKTDDRRRHMYLIGKTGMGKSTLLENMIVEDIRAGKGVAVVDPHGDLAEKIIEYIPTNRVNDVIYFNPSDIEYPIAFNVLEQVDSHLRHLVASGLIGVFQKLWADSWGPRLEYILRNTILAILDYPGSTLLGVTRMLSDKDFRKKVIDKIQDPVVKSFWSKEFAGYANNFASEAVSPIQNKVGQFLSSSLIRNIVGQVKSSINLRQVMDEGKILILNLSKGRIGEDNSSLLGSMMITKIQLAAMSRVDVPESERKDFYLYIDEFQNFTTDSFANILSEARKYRLNLIMAHQYIEQLGDVVKAAVFGNIGTLVVFRIGAADAEELVKEFTPTFIEEDLVNLPKYENYMKLMIDGVASNPFSARGLAPLSREEKTGQTEKVITVSRERYAKKREIVEDKIARWHSQDDDKPEIKETAKPKFEYSKAKMEERARAPQRYETRKSDNFREPRNEVRRPDNFHETRYEARKPEAFSEPKNVSERTEQKTEDIYKFDAKCARCGKATKISFAPDGVRPVFCKDCLALARQEKQNEIEARKRAKKEELLRLERESPRRFSENAETAGENGAVEKTGGEELSLGELLRKSPVDFRGREIDVNKEKNRSGNKPAVESGDKEDKGNDLDEGEEVKF